ncbi:hypothetical protein CAMRE0001_2159 [Campylobacter rectus RM3267]|uniref:Uncharacterized protein n=1 Tax=Campylobacter rectus RM3267 TaxID=553218 RepID=B9D463_CAMRE|nr:hypothetical protein CAMRE0001_2159 [Campylobacter rectus RM3267]
MAILNICLDCPIGAVWVKFDENLIKDQLGARSKFISVTA